MNCGGRTPLAEKYPLMEGEEFAAFKGDIAINGLKNPVWHYEGKILDGRNRLRACTELGIEPRFEEFTGTVAEAAAFVDSQNLHRRHLTIEFRRERVKALRATGMSTRAIADELKVDHSTVVRDLNRGGATAPPAPEPVAQEPQDESGLESKAHLAAMCGVSVEELNQAEFILKNGTPEVIAAVQAGKMDCGKLRCSSWASCPGHHRGLRAVPSPASSSARTAKLVELADAVVVVEGGGSDELVARLKAKGVRVLVISKEEPRGKPTLEVQKEKPRPYGMPPD